MFYARFNSVYNSYIRFMGTKSINTYTGAFVYGYRCVLEIYVSQNDVLFIETYRISTYR